ncbi:hypothetical protein ACS0TY_018623 [Phlomoides rotata]
MGLVWLWSREGKWILLQMNPFLRTALWDFIGTHDYILYSGILMMNWDYLPQFSN